MSAPDARAAPLELLLELVRAHEAGDAFHFRLEPQEYLLRRAQGSYARAALAWEPALLADLAELERPQPDRNVVQRLGERLRAFLEAVGWDAHARDILTAVQQDRPVHLTFRFAAAELYALPWELLTLGTSGRTVAELPGVLVRYEWPASQDAPAPATSRAGRILYAWSAAGGQVPAGAHLRELGAACEEGVYPFEPGRDVLPHVSLESLKEALERPGEPVSVLHLLCHGGRRGQTYGLLWNASWEGGEPELVDGATLRQLLMPYAGTLRLVVLCACQSGAGTTDNHLGSVAQALHRAGLPAVVASRLLLSVPGSVVLTRALYQSLLVAPASLEEAVGSARRQLALDTTALDHVSLQLYARAEHGSDTRPVALRPYRGLLPFRQEDRRFFFGREALQRELLQRVHEAVEDRRPRFQMLAGVSGSGKSSLALAGLPSDLRATGWEVRLLRPGQGHAEVLQQVRQVPPERRLLLLVDPFEDLFTALTPEARRALATDLWSLSRDAERRVVVLATLQVDFLGRCGDLVVDAGGTRLDAVVYSDAYRLFVSELQGEALRAAIEGPARKVGLGFEPGLVDRLLQDVGQEPGSLPLLQYALDQLWEEREGPLLTHRAYAALGGVAGALKRVANRLYAALSPGEQRQARRLLVELVDFQQGPAPGMRGRVRQRHLRPTLPEPRADFDRVLGTLLTARLLTRDEDAAGVEWLQLSHASLLRTWPELAEWARADQERLQHFRELQSWAHAWLAHRGEPDGGAPYLLSGSRLGYAQDILRRYSEEPGEDVLQLLDASVATAEAQDASARRRLVRLLVAALVVAGVMAGLAWSARQLEARARSERQEAQRYAQRARDLVLLDVARKLRRDNPTLALLMLREVQQPGQLQGWAQDVSEVLQEPLSRAVLRGHTQAVVHVEVSPDGQRVVTASKDGTARLWRTDGEGEPLVLAGHEGPVYHATFSPSGGLTVLTSSHDGTARLWSTSDGTLLRTFRHRGVVQWGAISPDGRWVATASRDGLARLWPLETADGPREVPHWGPVQTVAFSPDGKRLVTASQDGTARIVSVRTPEPPRELPHPAPVTSATFDPEGTHVLTVARDGIARVWPVNGAQGPVLLKGHQGELTTARFSPDGQWVVTASLDNTARVWRADGRGEPRVLRGHQGAVRMATFGGPLGEWILTVSSDTTARLWSTREDAPPRLLTGHRSTVLWGGFGPDGKQAVTASIDATARVWRLDAPRDSLPLQEPGGFVWSVAVGPDGTQVATASQDGAVRLWSEDGRLVRVLRGHAQDVRSVVFSPDGRWLLTASLDGTARLWPSDGSVEGRRVLVAQREPFFGAAFSPDGLWVALASSPRATRILRVDGTRAPLPLEGHGDQVRSVAFSADGRRLITASQDGTARIWSAEGRLLATLYGHDDWVLSAAFHPKAADQVLTSSQDGTARIWTVENGRVRGAHAILPHEAPVPWAAWSPDGSRLVTACADGRARVWLAAGPLEPYLVLSAHEGEVTSAVFSPRPEEPRLVTGSTDGSARVWRPREPLPVDRLQEKLQAASSACLTPGERRGHLGDLPARAWEATVECERRHGRTPLPDAP
ncbi:nSTAND1 domain-containing NTPase [Corallococcus carmarthensis]|uniref:CHAT domain-containing protein n=1 Tax=Corallococcus carmarthensis TaxID=2316728 RepID=A0A3A8KHR6_9BACT|nr:CHAT domain-containing protein [Corallococcus carmarthensis]RKH07096.1 CHAT domain-containing protein [Corallococcus carmarthensis]